jgi:undecaprenyl pyrophosphate synthase
MSNGPAVAPQHVAIIMDGNRRRAKNRGLPVLELIAIAKHSSSMKICNFPDMAREIVGRGFN